MSAGARTNANVQGERNARTVIGLLVAPIAGLVAALLGWGAYQIATGSLEADLSQFHRVLMAIWMSIVSGLFFGGPVALLIGWPFHLLLQRLNWRNFFVYMLFGAALGPAPILYMIADPGLRTLTLSAGAIGGLVFWVIRRPDKDQEKMRGAA